MSEEEAQEYVKTKAYQIFLNKIAEDLAMTMYVKHIENVAVNKEFSHLMKEFEKKD